MRTYPNAPRVASRFYWEASDPILTAERRALPDVISFKARDLVYKRVWPLLPNVPVETFRAPVVDLDLLRSAR